MGQCGQRKGGGRYTVKKTGLESSQSSASQSEQDPRLLERLAILSDTIRRAIGNTVIGQDRVVNELLVTLFAQGHLLLIGVPGLAKTLLIRTLARSLGLAFSRIQFTPDLMPSDITGTEILQQNSATGHREMVFRPGPLFANVVLADEINRTPPKTQAALLEAMQERQVTIGGVRRPLEPPFFVFATQNPIEQEGTYPLPEAQLDRFLLATHIGYPTGAEELEMLRRTTTDVPEPEVLPVPHAAQLLQYLQLVRRIPIAEHLMEYALQLVRVTRPELTTDDMIKRYVRFGAGPRATQSLVLAAKSHAAISARPCVTLDDLHAVLTPVLRHRILLNFAARAENVAVEALVTHIVERTPFRPDVSPRF